MAVRDRHETAAVRLCIEDHERDRRLRKGLRHETEVIG
jgi:hypothetical protein